MITEMKETYLQDRNRKLIKHLGYVPYHISTWGRKPEEPYNPPATLNTICPKCFGDLKIENKRDSIRWDDFNNQGGYTIEGNKWGYQVNAGRSRRIPYTIGTLGHGGHLLMIDHNDQSTGCLFRVYEEIES